MAHTIFGECEETLKKLYQFPERLLLLGEAINDNRLEEFETLIEFGLPLDFKYLLTKHNSFSIAGTEVYGLDKSFGESSLEKVYTFEHEEVGNPMYKEFLPFSPDGGGNHYCFDLSKLQDNICPVVFWQHDYQYTYKEDVEICNKSFVEWIHEVMIEWTLEDTNNDGSSKV